MRANEIDALFDEYLREAMQDGIWWVLQFAAEGKYDEDDRVISRYDSDRVGCLWFSMEIRLSIDSGKASVDVCAMDLVGNRVNCPDYILAGYTDMVRRMECDAAPLLKVLLEEEC